jgi:hypothetical protein
MHRNSNRNRWRFALGSILCCFPLLTSEAGAATNSAARSPGLDPKWGVGSWIWTDTFTDKQSCQFWRSFDLPENATVTKARLRITADNEYVVLLDGRIVGKGSDWRWLSEFDLTWLLAPGRHVLAVQAFNDVLKAGVLLGFHVELQNGETLEIASDETWRIVPDEETGWENRKKPRRTWRNARIAGAFGVPPWDTTPRGIAFVAPLHPIQLHFWQTAWFQITSFTICSGAILVCLGLWGKLALQSKAQLMLQRERARIARDIHDDLGAGLTQLVLLGELAQSESSDNGERRIQMEQLCEKSRGLLGSMDEVVWAVNSKRDTLRDFSIQACKYAQTFLASAAIRCRLDIEPDLPPEPFELPLRRNLFLAVKEALRNAAKHSRASELVLRIHRHNRSLEVIVEDDGTGFDPSLASDDRNGLSNMSHRMLEVGGECALTSAPGGGCRIVFRVPLARRHSGFANWFSWFRPAFAVASDSKAVEPALSDSKRGSPVRGGPETGRVPKPAESASQG